MSTLQRIESIVQELPSKEQCLQGLVPINNNELSNFESLKINQPPCTSLTPAIVRIDNPPAEESLPTVNSEKKNNAPLFTPQSKTITNSPVGYYSLSLNCEFSQTKKVLNYLPLFEDPGITEDNFDLSIFDDSELNFHKQASSDICRYFKQRD